MCDSCQRVAEETLPRASTWTIVRSFFVFHFLRHFPTWAASLPTHSPKLRSLDPGSGPAV
jgi:cardiolipin synthase